MGSHSQQYRAAAAETILLSRCKHTHLVLVYVFVKLWG